MNDRAHGNPNLALVTTIPDPLCAKTPTRVRFLVSREGTNTTSSPETWSLPRPKPRRPELGARDHRAPTDTTGVGLGPRAVPKASLADASSAPCFSAWPCDPATNGWLIL